MTEALMSTKAATLADAPDKLRLMAAACGPCDVVRWTLPAGQACKVAALIEAAETDDRRGMLADIRLAAVTEERVRAERLTAEARLSVQRSAMLAMIGLAALLAAITVVLM